MHRIQSKEDNIGENSIQIIKKKASITNKLFSKIPVKHKVKKNHCRHNREKIKVKSTVQGSTEGIKVNGKGRKYAG